MKKLNKKKTIKILLGIVSIFFLLSVLSLTTQAAGLIDGTINSGNNYSKYPVDNYSLDYFVDSKWDWLPWNWGDGIGKSVMFGIYSITNLIWLISVYLSNAAGYLIGEAYSLDFISDTTQAIGKNIQTLAGINQRGFMSSGFYPGLILILIMIMGIYVTYTGLIKRETTKATGALVSFLTIFILSSSFIAYSTSYITRINEFSSDISKAALDIGSKMTMPNSNSKGKDSVDAIRDSLFEIQVKKPWMILQYGESDTKKVGKERVESLESTSPFANKGKDRIEIVKDEINKKNNDNMTITKTVSRLGVTFFIFIFNILISIFVFILTGIMIFSQVLFIVFAIFLPISFLLSMIPSFNHLMKTTIMRLFNVIMMRAGITLVLTIAFSLSTMIYGLTANQPFFIVAFMQIVVFAGIYFKLNDLMGMMALNSTDSQNTGSRVIRRPKQSATRAIRKIAIGGLALKGIGSTRKDDTSKKKIETKNRQKKTDSNENGSTKKREQLKDKKLPDKFKNPKEKDRPKKKETTIGKDLTNTQQIKDKAKQETTRKFKQSNYKEEKNKSPKDQMTPSLEKKKTSQRRNLPTRTLEKSKRKPIEWQEKQSTKVDHPRKVSEEKTQQKGNKQRKYGKKSPVKMPPIKQNNRLDLKREMKPLKKGRAIEREVKLNNDKRPSISKTKEERSIINGKGAKRK